MRLKSRWRCRGFGSPRVKKPSREGFRVDGLRTFEAKVSHVAIREVLGPSGPLSRSLSGYEDRPGQLAMADAVEQALAERSRAHLRSGHRHRQDLGLPRPGDSERQKGRHLDRHPRPPRANLHQGHAAHSPRRSGSRSSAALMKGLSNYLCLRRFDEYRARAPRARTARVARARHHRGLGRRNRLGRPRRASSGLTEDDPVWREVSSSSDTRIGQGCDHFRRVLRHPHEARGRGRAHRGRQPPPFLRRSRAARPPRGAPPFPTTTRSSSTRRTSSRTSPPTSSACGSRRAPAIDAARRRAGLRCGRDSPTSCLRKGEGAAIVDTGARSREPILYRARRGPARRRPSSTGGARARRPGHHRRDFWTRRRSRELPQARRGARSARAPTPKRDKPSRRSNSSPGAPTSFAAISRASSMAPRTTSPGPKCERARPRSALRPSSSRRRLQRRLFAQVPPWCSPAPRSPPVTASPSSALAPGARRRRHPGRRARGPLPFRLSRRARWSTCRAISPILPIPPGSTRAPRASPSSSRPPAAERSCSATSKRMMQAAARRRSRVRRRGRCSCRARRPRACCSSDFEPRRTPCSSPP